MTLTPPSLKRERIAKVMAASGLCSRRDAERWILESRVKVNGETLTTPAFLVGPDDLIVVDGNPLTGKEAPRIWRFYKPKGLLTTHKDPQGRPTVFSFLREKAPTLPRVISVGRLDFNSEGLLLLTTDGATAHYMESPKTAWIRKYKVRVFGNLRTEMLVQMTEGIKIDDVMHTAHTVQLDSKSGQNSWVTLTLKEGKNREIRKLFEHFGLQVSRLIRLSYGPFSLGALEEGALDEVNAPTLKNALPKILQIK